MKPRIGWERIFNGELRIYHIKNISYYTSSPKKKSLIFSSDIVRTTNLNKLNIVKYRDKKNEDDGHNEDDAHNEVWW